MPAGRWSRKATKVPSEYTCSALSPPTHKSVGNYSFTASTLLMRSAIFWERTWCSLVGYPAEDTSVLVPLGGSRTGGGGEGGGLVVRSCHDEPPLVQAKRARPPKRKENPLWR